MHAENPDNFQIPHPVLKKHVSIGHFVELRIDLPRFSVHDDAVEQVLLPDLQRRGNEADPEPRSSSFAAVITEARRAITRIGRGLLGAGH